MRRRKGSELATGALVLAAGVVATWGYFWLTSQPLGHSGYNLVVQLADAGGLQRGDRVRVAGVQVGTVRQVSLHDRAVLAEAARVVTPLELHSRVAWHPFRPAEA